MKPLLQSEFDYLSASQIQFVTNVIKATNNITVYLNFEAMHTSRLVTLTLTTLVMLTL
jgi:hypothetical protein